LPASRDYFKLATIARPPELHRSAAFGGLRKRMSETESLVSAGKDLTAEMPANAAVEPRRKSRLARR
jgi:hypothetical protein